MALKRLKWLRYLFVGRAEGETEQSYWNEKRRKHLAHEHSAGVVHGLEVTAASPPSLSVRIAGGRAVDADGNDPEVESVQELDLTSLVPSAGEATVYIALSFTESEVEPYFVDEIGEYQNKYIQDGAHLEVLSVPPSAPAVELARVALAAGATEIVNAPDPQSPGPNEIDLTHRDYSGKEVLAFEDLADVSPDEAAALNGMTSPSASNPVATLADVGAGISPIAAEVIAARGSSPSLDERLDVALGEDGSLKGHAGTHKGDGADAIAAATPSVAGLMSAGDKAKLDTVESGAVAAGEAGDGHAGLTSGNPHALDAADVGAAPTSHIGTGGGEHALATGSVAGFMSAADKAALDGHIGAGGGAHALAIAGGAAGFMSGADKTKLDGLTGGGGGGGTWTALDPGAGNLETQMAGMQPGQKFWLAPGTYTLGATIIINQSGVWLAGTREAVVVPAADAEINVTGEACRLFGFEIRNNSTAATNRCVHLAGAHSSVEEMTFRGEETGAARRTAVSLAAYHCAVRRCRFFVGRTVPSAADPLIRLYPYCAVEDNYVETWQNAYWDTWSVMVGAGSSSIVECRVLRNDFNILIQPAESVTVIAGDGPSGSFAGWISDNRISVNMAGNYITGISLSGNFVVHGNRVTGCGRYGIYSEGVVDGMQITNNKVIGLSGDYTGSGIRLHKVTAGSVADSVTIAGNYVRYCEFGILVYYDTSDIPRGVNVLGNAIQDVSSTAIRVSGASPYFLEQVNVNDNVVNGFSTGIYMSDCRRGSCANNQLTGGTGTGINLLGGGGSYDIKVVACDVETTGQYCYSVGHERNSIVSCSGRGASVAIFSVSGYHNTVAGCHTEAVVGTDILCVEGERHNIHDNDFSYGVSSGYYSVKLMGTTLFVLVHGNRLHWSADYGAYNLIHSNVVNDIYRLSGF
jgi:hypothetical protein